LNIAHFIILGQKALLFISQGTVISQLLIVFLNGHNIDLITGIWLTISLLMCIVFYIDDKKMFLKTLIEVTVFMFILGSFMWVFNFNPFYFSH
jgi:hypothetical protein